MSELPESHRPWYGRAVASLCFSSDGRWLAGGYGHPDGEYFNYLPVLRVWDVSGRRRMHTLTGHANTIPATVFSPDGRSLLTGSHDSTVRIWKVGEWGRPRVLTGFSDRIFSVAVSPDGRTLAAGCRNGIIELRRLPTGQPLRSLKGHGQRVYGLAFSPDGRRLASASIDQTVRWWNVSTGRETLRLLGHEAWVVALALSPDGNTLATGDFDGALRLWEAEPVAGSPSSVVRLHQQPVTHNRQPAHGPTSAWHRREVHLCVWRQDWRAALRHLDAIIRANGTSWRDRIARGRALAWLDRWREAEAEIARATALAPRDAELWIERGCVYAERERWGRAAADLDHALSLARGDPMVWYRRALSGIGASQSGAYREVRARMLSRVVARRPRDPDAWTERGHVHAELRRWKEAVFDFGHALSLNPVPAELWRARGDAFAEQGEWKQAAADFAHALERGVGVEEPWVLRDGALAALGAGDIATYHAFCDRALERFGSTEDSDIAWGVATTLSVDAKGGSDPGRAVSLAEKAVTSERTVFGPNWEYRSALALALYRAGRFDAALQRVKEAMAANPDGDNGANRLLRSMIHRRLGQPAEASRWLQKGLRWRAGAGTDWRDRLRYELLRRETGS